MLSSISIRRLATFWILFGWAIGLMTGLAPAAQATVSFFSAPAWESGNGLLLVEVGDAFAIDVTVRSDGSPVVGLAAYAYGYDPDILEFIAAQTTPQVLSAICLPDLGCLGGLTNVTALPVVEENGEVEFFSAVSLAPVVYTGEADIGVSGALGDAQARLYFRVIDSGGTTISVGTGPSGGVYIPGFPPPIIEPAVDSEFDVLGGFDIPEPTIGLGLAIGILGLLPLGRIKEGNA